MATPLLEIEGLFREFPSGDETISVLKNITLTIEAGEMVAIVGASGSGKSTLMNILGCLDRPTRGSYRISGRDTQTLSADDLAKLRREYFGFIFQRYHLLGDLDAVANVEIPAIYAGRAFGERRSRAQALLRRLGLQERLDHRPSQLSGGQQQRVSIARALMNGGQVILADEPTGALDRHSGQEMLALMEELHREGHTIVIVTHDMSVAEHAQRIIEISDGEIIADRRSPSSHTLAEAKTLPPPSEIARPAWKSAWDRGTEALKMALLSLSSHRLRTFLTMLGIIIGIASVVSVVALGQGSRQKVLENISSMGTSTLDILPGKGRGDRNSRNVKSLMPSDVAALAREPYVDSVTPSVSSSTTLRYRNKEMSATVYGVGDAYFQVRGYSLASGSSFSAQAIRQYSQDVVIDENTRKSLFPDTPNPLGEVIFIGTVPCRVVAITAPRQTTFGDSDALNVWLPYTTAMSRILGQSHFQSIIVRVKESESMSEAEGSVTALLGLRHGGKKDFFVINTDTIRETIDKTTETMTLLVSAIALISLVVGGIGVMNIMLVSVTERTREIGVRMAVGARRIDILTQFLIEAVTVCLVGGILGILLSLGVGFVFSELVGSFQMIYSGTSILAAFICSSLIGILFGFLPARSAARLDPVEALARE